MEATGADYLRRLRNTELELSGPPVEEPPAPTPTLSQPPAVERRRSARFQCHGSVKFRQEGSEVHSWGTFTDVSLNGCYIEVTATFPLGVRLDLTLEVNGLRAEMIGEVRVSYPFLGMGIAFREMSEEDRQRLEEMVRSAASPARAIPTPLATGADASQCRSEKAEPHSDPRRALEALVDFFETRALLSREQFYRLLRDSQPSR